MKKINKKGGGFKLTEDYKAGTPFVRFDDRSRKLVKTNTFAVDYTEAELEARLADVVRQLNGYIKEVIEVEDGTHPLLDTFNMPQQLDYFIEMRDGLQARADRLVSMLAMQDDEEMPL